MPHQPAEGLSEQTPGDYVNSHRWITRTTLPDRGGLLERRQEELVRGHDGWFDLAGRRHGWFEVLGVVRDQHSRTATCGRGEMHLVGVVGSGPRVGRAFIGGGGEPAVGERCADFVDEPLGVRRCEPLVVDKDTLDFLEQMVALDKFEQSVLGGAERQVCERCWKQHVGVNEDTWRFQYSMPPSMSASMARRTPWRPRSR